MPASSWGLKEFLHRHLLILKTAGQAQSHNPMAQAVWLLFRIVHAFGLFDGTLRMALPLMRRDFDSVRKPRLIDEQNWAQEQPIFSLLLSKARADRA